jgi:hypothetical protein
VAGIVFSCLASAMDAAEELKNQLDKDVYIIKREYPSGEEFTLSVVDRGSYVYVSRVLPSHIFSPTKHGKRQAFEYAKQYNLFVKQNKKKVNGYIFTQSYTLVKKIPKDV